ncbi:hypothetical protein B0O99DRAFT_669355 [Bisporella sp. PMI_857]|nr:hypothetical protein B0O99DRAFT_669355 [Bisporella sp. PMI_857]
MHQLKVVTSLLFARGVAISAIPVGMELKVDGEASLVDLAQLSPSQLIPSGEGQSSPDHGPPYCNPTGVGVCNFAFYERGNHTCSTCYDREAFVYNHYCQQIGRNVIHGLEGSYKQKFTGLPLENELIYVHKDRQFWYDGTNYGLFKRKPDCISYADWSGTPKLYVGRLVQCAFDCGTGEEWDHMRRSMNFDPDYVTTLAAHG